MSLYGRLIFRWFRKVSSLEEVEKIRLGYALKALEVKMQR